MSKEIIGKCFVEASITWIRVDIIQRKIDNNTQIYYLNIKFLSNPILWSVKIYVDSISKQFQKFENKYITQIGFLFEDDILVFLQEGMDFWLLEGPYSLVGKGTIIMINNNSSEKH
jgi:hypothetical protein